MTNTIRVLEDAIAKAEAEAERKPPTLAESMLSRTEQILKLRSHGMTRSALATLLKPGLEADGIRASVKAIRDAMPGPKLKKKRAKKASSTAASAAAASASATSSSESSQSVASSSELSSSGASTAAPSSLESESTALAALGNSLHQSDWEDDPNNPEAFVNV